MIYHVIDVPGYPIIQCFPAFVRALEQLGPGEKALLHCVAGVSRSAAMCAAFLAKQNQWNAGEAYTYIRRRRKVVSDFKVES